MLNGATNTTTCTDRITNPYVARSGGKNLHDTEGGDSLPDTRVTAPSSTRTALAYRKTVGGAAPHELGA